jgi:hypothetical protein
VRDAVDAHLTLGHRLEQRRLGFRWCPVDLVGQQQVRENRSGAELEPARLHVVHRRAQQVGGQQVRGELHSLEIQPQCGGERPRDQRLAEAGQVLDEHVSACQHGGENQGERVALADHHAPDLVEYGLAVRGGGCAGQARVLGHIAPCRQVIRAPTVAESR